MLVKKIGIIGLGYVGLPLAIAFSKKFMTVGFDINQNRVSELQNGIDKTGEVAAKQLTKIPNLLITSNQVDLVGCNFIIVTVPTPIDALNVPDLTALENACEIISKVIKKGDIVIFESTVFPGATEEYCVPIIENGSGLKYNSEFFCGYSPERINPGDKTNTVENIVKVTSGCNDEVATLVDDLYKSIIVAGTFKAESIKVAEAAKVIENTQRDVNIALMNEFSRIFNNMGIDTSEVLKAANTKWNFIKMTPGFVGGHCIGIDPYYLLHKSKSLGYMPDIINTSRELNESIPRYVADQYIKLSKLKRNVRQTRCLIAGITFKANCPDLRNSKVVELIKYLREEGIEIEIIDPYVDNIDLPELTLYQDFSQVPNSTYDGLIICVEHDYFKELTPNEWTGKLVEEPIVIDLKAIYPKTFSKFRL